MQLLIVLSLLGAASPGGRKPIEEYHINYFDVDFAGTGDFRSDLRLGRVEGDFEALKLFGVGIPNWHDPFWYIPKGKKPSTATEKKWLMRMTNWENGNYPLRDIEDAAIARIKDILNGKEKQVAVQVMQSRIGHPRMAALAGTVKHHGEIPIVVYEPAQVVILVDGVSLNEVLVKSLSENSRNS